MDRYNDDDHDLLMRIDANLLNFIKRFDEHIQQFLLLQEKVALLQKYLWMGIGSFVIIELFIRYFK